MSKIDVSILPTGNYILKLKTEKGEETFKIIKSN
ncbi:T9SS type A sorting domain-containing protein [Epilithonimonas hominis]|nr:T9SS type A sorting domain-containing protein [Epilithonimonas hominis]